MIGSFSKNCEKSCSGALRKVEAASTLSATCKAIFRCETSCKHGVSHEEVFLATCNATPLRLQVARKIASCDMAFTLLAMKWPFFCNNFI